MPLTVELDRSSPVPLYYQLAQAIEAAIRDGELSPGDRFENELALAKRLTLVAADDEACDTGARRQRSAGPQARGGDSGRTESGAQARRADKPFRRPRPRRPGADHSAAGLCGRTTQRGGRARAQHFRGSRGGHHSSAAVRQRRTTGSDDQPPADRDRTRCRGTRDASACTRRCDRAVCTSGWRASESAPARATRSEARLLDEKAGAPLLTMARTAFDDSGSAVEFGTHCYRASRYYFDTTLVDR